MPIVKCTSPGCGGTIDQGFCDRCGLAPAAGATAAVAVSSQLLTRARTDTRAGSSATRATSGTTATGAMSGRTGSTGSSTRRGTGTSRSSTRRHLGLGLVNVPGLPEINPEQIVMADPKVPDHKRFCSNPDCHDAAGEPTPLNRRLTGHCPNCGRFYSFVPTLKAGDVIAEQYEVKGCLAYGGLGWIYLAKDLTLSRWVVLKGLLNSADESAAAAAVAERQFLASVKHANIVGIYSFVKRGTEGFIVMEYVNGTTVKDVRKSRGPLPAGEAISYIHRILGAFAYLHDRGLVFCDFKPDNFMLEGDPPDVKLIDMGGVRLIDDPAGDIYGTKGYSAPEAGEGPTVATDLFTIGRTLALLVMDFRFQSAFEFTIPPASEQPVLAQHQSLNRFLLKSTAKDPRERFQSADEMAEQLGGVLREVVVTETGQASTKVVYSTLFAGEPAGLDDKCDVDKPSVKLLPALRIDSEDPGADDLLALSGVRDPAKLIPLLQAAVKRQPDSVEIPLQLLRALIEHGDYEEAESALLKLEQRLPHDWRPKWYRGLLTLGQNRVGHAATALDQVCTDIPGEPAAKLALAVAAELAGDDAAAIHLYDLVSATDPGMATAAFGLARCLRRAGRRADAAEAYRRVPPGSSLYVRAQTALARALACMEPAPPAVDDLCGASSVIESLSLEGMEGVRVRAEVLENALSLLVAQPALADRSRQLFGQQLAETPIRFALEKSYRQMARLEPDRGRQIQLVDKANTIRPWTLI
jgi:serine/threonine-protein kinase PknG